MKRLLIFLVILLVILPVLAFAQDDKPETLQYLISKYDQLPQQFFLNAENGVGFFSYGESNNPEAVMVVDTITQQPLIFIIQQQGESFIVWAHKDLKALCALIEERKGGQGKVSL